MQRREFLTLAGGISVAGGMAVWPLTGRAQDESSPPARSPLLCLTRLAAVST
jgi:hypothetical protein